MEVHQNRDDLLSNTLRLNKIYGLIFFQVYSKINRNQLQIVVEANYGLHPY